MSPILKGSKFPFRLLNHSILFLVTFLPLFSYIVRETYQEHVTAH